jgi:hypothetical protein
MFAKQYRGIYAMLSILALATLSIVIPVFTSTAQAHKHSPVGSQDQQLQIKAVFGAVDSSDDRPSAFIPGGIILYRIDVFNNGALLPSNVGFYIVGPNGYEGEEFSQAIPSLPSKLTRFAKWSRIPTNAPAGIYTIHAQIHVGNYTNETDAVGSFRVRSLVQIDLSPDKTKSESAKLKQGMSNLERYVNGETLDKIVSYLSLASDALSCAGSLNDVYQNGSGGISILVYGAQLIENCGKPTLVDVLDALEPYGYKIEVDGGAALQDMLDSQPPEVPPVVL